MAKKPAAKPAKKAVKKGSRKLGIGASMAPTLKKSAPGKKSAVKKAHRFR